MNARYLVMLFGAAVATAAGSTTSFGQTESNPNAVYEDWCLRIDDQVMNNAGVEGTVVSSHCDPQDEKYDVEYEDGSNVSYFWSQLIDRHDAMPKLVGRSHKTYDAMHGLPE